MEDYIISLKKAVKTGKLSQAETLLDQTMSLPEEDRQAVIQILALASDKTAFRLLSYLVARVKDDNELYGRLIQLATDRAHLNFNFIKILFNNTDKASVSRLVPLIRHILSRSTDNELLSLIIKTAGKFKIDALTDDIAEFIFYDDISLKGEAVRALERIASQNALEKLEGASKTSKCDQDILDAVQILRDNIAPLKDSGTPDAPAETSGLSEAEPGPDPRDLASPEPEKRFRALMHFAGQGADLTARLLKYLESEPSGISPDQYHDLKINILRLVARTMPSGIDNTLFAVLNQKKIGNSVKFAVYNALEAFPKLESGASLIKGLSEPGLCVRIAAIKALDKNLSDFVCAEIKNLVESGTQKGEILAQTILDARATNIMDYLMISDTFSYMASNYLDRTASITAVDSFIEVLKQRKLKSTAKKYIELKKQKTCHDPRPFIVISSSEAILDTYNKIISGCGFACRTFKTSQDAFEFIVSTQPMAVICDLFLNDMTAMELAGEVRELYSREQVPVIISTLQKSLDPDLLSELMNSAGIKTTCNFPAKPMSIKSWVSSGA
jgi:CheY-like chemotaxis protein